MNRAQNLLRVAPSPLRPRSRQSLSDSTDIGLEDGYGGLNPASKIDMRQGLYRPLVRFDAIECDNTQRVCWKWFCRYLDDSIRQDWKTILAPVIKELDPVCPNDAQRWNQQLPYVYEVLGIIADAITAREDISVDGIMDELNLRRLLRTEEVEGAGPNLQDPTVMRQMIWTLAGTITMLYDPKRCLHSKQLCLKQPASSLRRGALSRLGDISSYQQDIDKCRDPLHSLLAEHLPKVELDSLYLSTLDHINIAYINFYTLKNVANLDIEWVNTLNLHLQLDKRKRILRLYRFPAFCRLLWNETDDSFMSKLFADHRRSQVDADRHTEHTFPDYLREVILSYRLLFGMDKKSRNAFKAELPKWRKGLLGGNTSISTNTSSSSGHGRNDANDGQHRAVTPQLQQQGVSELDDPLLMLLCTTSTTEPSNTRHLPFSPDSLNNLLALLYGEEKSGLYDLEDFPFLGRRLGELQRFSLIQKPNDWKSIFLTDRRDPQSFWNNWSGWILLFIGGGTIILQLCQLVVQFFQTW